MVKLTEVEDEHFSEKPGAGDEALLVDDDEDYTDTDSELSEDDFPAGGSSVYGPDESIAERLSALKDIIPPTARSRIASTANTLYRTTSSGIQYGGKGLWIIVTSVLLFGMPYALAFGAEQEMMEEERQRTLMAEGAQGMMAGSAEGEKAAL